MTLEQLQQRFMLQQPQPIAAALASQQPNAAVMLLCWPQAAQLELLLLKRALHLRHHPGQVSLPGGKIEPGETSKAAALRETAEETGIAPSQIQVLGTLPKIETSTGFIIEPWCGILAAPPQLTLQQEEVAAAFTVPLPLLTATQADQSQWQVVLLQQRSYAVFPYQGQLIWGATAMMLQHFIQQIKQA